MADIKLFRLEGAEGGLGVQELQGTSVQLEKSLQTLIERNLEQLEKAKPLLLKSYEIS